MRAGRMEGSRSRSGMWGQETLGNVCRWGWRGTEGEPGGAGEREVIVITVISLRRQGSESQAQVEGLSALGQSGDTSPIATGQKTENTNTDAERPKSWLMNMFLSDCFCVLNQVWGETRSGEWWGQGGVVWEVWGEVGNLILESGKAQVHTEGLPPGRSECPCEIWGYKWTVRRPALLFFSTGVQLPLHRSERDCAKWRPPRMSKAQ